MVAVLGCRGAERRVVSVVCLPLLSPRCVCCARLCCGEEGLLCPVRVARTSVRRQVRPAHPTQAPSSACRVLRRSPPASPAARCARTPAVQKGAKVDRRRVGRWSRTRQIAVRVAGAGPWAASSSAHRKGLPEPREGGRGPSSHRWRRSQPWRSFAR